MPKSDSDVEKQIEIAEEAVGELLDDLSFSQEQAVEMWGSLAAICRDRADTIKSEME